MRLTVKIGYPTSQNVLNNDWKLVPELISNKNTAIFVAIAIGVILKELLGLMFTDLGFVSYKQLYLLLLIIPIHELLHILFFPYNSETIAWIDLKRLSFYVTSNGEFSKKD